jgi:hypothetical protein
MPHSRTLFSRQLGWQPPTPIPSADESHDDQTPAASRAALTSLQDSVRQNINTVTGTSVLQDRKTKYMAIPSRISPKVTREITAIEFATRERRTP